MAAIDDTRLPLASADPLAELRSRLQELAPQVFADGRLDLEKLRLAVGEAVESGVERYGLGWAGKSEAFRNVQTPSVGTLLPMPDESVAWDSTGNLIIEGDNLEVLKLLQKPYHGKVKTIYIDPPYNTGNDFIYPDNYREGLDDYLRYSGQVSEEGLKQSTNTETSGRFHSKWLSMMYPRLFLARNLLREDGVIFVSIDDNEVHNLRMLMNEVFGEENRVECFIWKKSYGGGAKERFAVTQHEYILMYAKDIGAIDSLWLPPDKDAESKYYKFKDEKLATRGPYRLKPLEATKSMDRRENLVYPIPGPDGREILPKRQWWWSKERALQAIANDELVFTKSAAGYSVSYKQYLKDEEGAERKAKPFSILDGPYTQTGTADLAKCFGGTAVIQFPKPVELMKKLIAIGDTGTRDGVVLDFFAGSATTGQAVLSLNAEDQGGRQFILVQLPERTDNPEYPTIAHITRARVRNVIKQNEASDGFRAFKLSSSNFKIWDSEKTSVESEALSEQLKLYADNVVHARGPQDVLYELILKSGLPPSSKVERTEVAGIPVWSVEGRELMICLENPVTQDVLRGMLAAGPRRILCLDVAFGGNDKLKTNAVLEARSHNISFHTI